MDLMLLFRSDREVPLRWRGDPPQGAGTCRHPMDHSRMQGASLTGIRDWLEQSGLGKYAEVFAEHEITLEVLPHLTESDIDRLAAEGAV